MLQRRRAVIDVGTNSVKLLVADIEDGAVQPVVEKSCQTRLGRGFYESHRLQADAVADTAKAVAEFTELARQLEARQTRVIATSAARDALNQQDLLHAIRLAAGLSAEIISGDQEAEWVFRGVCTDARLANHQLLILEVGGGSTELVVGRNHHHSFRQSFPIGAVRLSERLRPGDPPSLNDLASCRAWLANFFNHQIAPAIETSFAPAQRSEARLVGTGGTSTVLACMSRQMAEFDRDTLDKTRLSKTQVLDWMVRLWGMSLAERRKITGLPSNRADIILMGVAIFEAVMEHFQFQELNVSTRGLRFGAILDAGGSLS